MNELEWLKKGATEELGVILGLRDSERYTYFQIEPSKKKNQSKIFVFNSEYGIANEIARIFIKVKGDINTAKKLVEQTVRHFESQRNMSIKSVEKYLHKANQQQNKSIKTRYER